MNKHLINPIACELGEDTEKLLQIMKWTTKIFTEYLKKEFGIPKEMLTLK